jgi:surface polysaccharide O-acyltransferase-like enzyme
MLANPQPALIQPKTKINYIDHIKVLLTVLVIMHHACVTYGASGGWYYSEKSKLIAAVLPMTIFVSVNQAFFMGFFFFLSALFIPSSYEKKGVVKFVTDRLVRLGIPLVVYSLILSPFMSYLVYYFAKGNHITYTQYLGGYDNWIEFGVLWFVAALLLFTLAYAAYRALAGKLQASSKLPGLLGIIFFAISIGFISFVVRIVFPVGWVLKPLGFQPGHFAQYIAMFTLGIIASSNKWLSQTTYAMGRRAKAIVTWLIIIGFPLFFVARTLLKFPVDWFSSGLHWQQLWYAIWEQVLGFTMVTALLCIGKERWNKPSAFLSALSRATFAVYIFHPLVLISLSMLLRTWAVDPGLKVLIVAPLGVVFSFLLGLGVVRIPGINKVV